MNLKFRVALFIACFALTATFAAAATAVTAYPDPIQFGTISLNSTSQYIYVYVTNTSVTAVTISNMTISGTGSGSFAFAGSPCIGTISGSQTCQMFMTFTPSAMGSLSATLAITEAGLTAPINIPLQGAGGNPIPYVTSLSPPTVYVKSPTTKIAINGTGFSPSTSAYLQNSNTPLVTAYVSATQVTAQIPDTVLSSIGALYLYVTNPAPGGGTTSTTLQVVSPEPTIGGIAPTSIVAGTASEPILVNGQNFMSGATVKWNGVSIPTTYNSSTQLQAQPTTAQLASAGIIQLAVSNPAPGTLSPASNFDVTYPVTLNVLDLPANDLVWDPFAQLIYASLPSSYGTNGNSIAVINPATGAVTGFHFAGSEPTKLALDSTAKYLYVGLNGNGSVQRLNLPAFTPDIDINLGGTNGATLAGAIAVSPTNSHTVAVALESGCCGSSSLDFFTDSTKLTSAVNTSINQLAFANGTTLYGYSPNTLSKIAVSATGGTLGQQWSYLVTGDTFQYSGGLIFGSSGEEFNPVTGSLVGTFDVGSNNCCCCGTEVLPNSSINRAFALGQTPFFTGFGITSYNLGQFTPLAVADLSELSPGYNSITTSKFIQWGTNGLAFILNSGCCGNTTSQVVLLQSPTLLLTSTKIKSPTPVSQLSSPSAVSHGSGNFRMSVRGTGFVPGSVVMWNGKTSSASFVSPTQMTVYVPAASITSAGTATLEVKNPAPGGGKSNTLPFTIK